MPMLEDIKISKKFKIRHFEISAIMENARGVKSGTQRFFTPRDLVNTFQSKNSMCTKILGPAKKPQKSPGLLFKIFFINC